MARLNRLFPAGALLVHSPSDKIDAVMHANRRYARRAVSWYALDPIQVEKALRTVRERQGQGESVDFLDTLRQANLLTQSQADRLRLDKPPVDGETDDTPQERVTRLDPPTSVDASEPKQMGPYRILRKLGEGGMGAVYLGFDAKLNQQVAVKVLSSDHAPRQNILQRFQREGKHGAMLAHPNIVRTFDAGLDADTGLHYIVLEFVDGPNAQDLLERFGKLSLGDAVHITLDIAGALEHAHKKQIIHRDIKPGNILLTASGLAKLSDLGLAKRRDDPTSITQADQGIGTPYYMPYEQAMNAKMADERSDIYALGATLYHLLTGEVPFPGESSLEVVEKKAIGAYRPARELNPDLPDTLEAIVAHMLARDPDDRYQTVSEVIVDLDRSQLAAAIPSFVHLDSALKDPVVRERLTAPVEATQPDLQLKAQIAENAAQQVWFLRYKDKKGNLIKAKGSVAEINTRLEKGTIPTNAEASRSAQGKFRPIRDHVEFREAVAAANDRRKANESKTPPLDKVPTRSANSRWIALAALGVGLVITVSVVIYYFVVGF